MDIQTAFEAISAIDPSIKKVSEQQHFPAYTFTSSFDYRAYVFDGDICFKSYYSSIGWEDLIQKVRDEYDPT